MARSAAVRCTGALVLFALLSRGVLARAAEAGPSAPEAQAPSSSTGATRSTPDRRRLATATAVVPGLVAHGAGHYVAGRTDTGTRLLVAEGVGLGMLLVGGGTIALSGASRYLVGPGTVVTLAGAGLFATTYFADVYGVASPDPGAAQQRSRVPPSVETELGIDGLFAPKSEAPGFVWERVEVRAGRLRVTPVAWFATRGTIARYRIEGAYRLHGLSPGSPSPGRDDYVDVVVGALQHRAPDAGYSRASVELELASRYDLSHVGPTLAGGFVELSAGYAAGRVAYELPGIRVPADFDPVLLSRFGFGAVLRGPFRAGSEALVYYDHRHDALVGGLLLRGLGSGAAGHFGAKATGFFCDELGLALSGEVGSAWLAGVSMVFRQGGATRGARR